LSRKHLTEACHEALQRLQTDYLDLYFCHRPDKSTPIIEVVQTMNTLIQQGKILYWGTSEWSGVEIMEAHRVAADYRLIGPSVEQPQYNLFERNKVEKEYLEIYKNVGLGTTIWSPLASGLLTGKYNDGIPEDSRFQLEGYEWLRDQWVMQDKIKRVQQLGAIAKALKVSTASLCIAWCIKNPNVTTAILGATKKEQLLDNLTAMNTLALLTPEIMEQIEGIVETKPIQPEW
jgi:aryl-alcohol dehydrogenase-like predicted oxidoreductase